VFRSVTQSKTASQGGVGEAALALPRRLVRSDNCCNRRWDAVTQSQANSVRVDESNGDFLQAYAGKDLMLVYALPDGESFVFSTRRGGMRPCVNDADWQGQHVP